MSRPIESEVLNAKFEKHKRMKKKKVETHEAGKRSRYFADDERYDLKQLFEREKLSTAEDQNAMMSRLAGRAIDKTNDDFDIDDMFTDRAARKESDEKMLAKERDRAIEEHKRMTKSLDECQWCLNSKKMKKHLMIAMGDYCYLALPGHVSLTEGHCFIVPISHTSCSTQLDENVWAEMQTFRKSLVRMFNQEGDENESEDCVFYELTFNLRRNPHMIYECVPLPMDVGNLAPMYFQKAIQECESEWSHNKKLVSLKSKDIRRAVPKGLPYFHVDFGLQDGFAHVIEDEQDFPRNFAQEIVGGILDLDPRFWRNPRIENFESQKQKVIRFGAKWRKFDFTKDNSSSSSSDSD